MNIRKAVMNDATEITEILNEVIAIGGTTAYQSPKSRAYFTRFIEPEAEHTFLHVAEVDGKVYGFQWMNPDETGMGQIATFAKPGTAQRGIGTALFHATRAACVMAGYSELDATIRADNTSGLAYYSKMGFVDHSVSKAVPLSDGTPVDRVHKRLVL